MKKLINKLLEVIEKIKCKINIGCCCESECNPQEIQKNNESIYYT